MPIPPLSNTDLNLLETITAREPVHVALHVLRRIERHPDNLPLLKAIAAHETTHRRNREILTLAQARIATIAAAERTQPNPSTQPLDL